MKILYVHQYFKTPDEGGSIRSYYLAKGLVDQGHQVTMVTSHPVKNSIENIDGISVHYKRVNYRNHFGFVRRVYAFVRFVYLARKEVARIAKHDLAYVMTTPLTTGLIGLYIKKKFNIPFYFEVGDLWPEAPIKIGAIRNEILKKILYRFEKKCYYEAQRVVALSPAIRNYIEATSPETKVHVLPNISDCSFFEPQIKLQHFDKENPLKIGYFGTFGAANQLRFLIEAAKQSYQEGLPITFTLMGEGGDFKEVRQKAKRLPNVAVLKHGSAFQVKDELEKQDAVYISFKNLEILNTGSPNKFFDGLAGGKLIIINFGGWIRNVIESNRCGFFHDPLSPEEFTRKIKVFLKEPSLLLEYQSQSRKLAETYYDKELQVKKLLKILSNEKKLGVSDSEYYILTA